MREPILLMLLAIAFVTFLSIFAARAARPRGIGRAVDIVGGILGMLFWGVVALGSLGIERANPATGEVMTYSEPALAWVAVALVAINFVVMLDGTQRLIDTGSLRRDAVEEIPDGLD